VLMKAGFKLENLQPVDMFPHTAHVETVALIELK
jgi:tRNA/tmRNA/rRNA uracil-C5-methylase (TrmA/RlmC/RlmD family)